MSPEYRFIVQANLKDDEKAKRLEEAIGLFKGVRGVAQLGEQDYVVHSDPSDDSPLPLNEISLRFNRSTDHLRHVISEKSLPHEYDEKGHLLIRPSTIQDYLSHVRVGRPPKQ